MRRETRLCRGENQYSSIASSISLSPVFVTTAPDKLPAYVSPCRTQKLAPQIAYWEIRIERQSRQHSPVLMIPAGESTGRRWLNVATSRPVVRRSAKVSLIVGTILIGINQGNLILSGSLSPDLYWKIPLTYCVPFAVSTYAAVDAILSRSLDRQANSS